MVTNRTRYAVAGLWALVQPTFFLPAVATALFGAVLAEQVSPPVAAVHALAVAFAMYTAHLTDGYVDFYRRGEDDRPALSARGFRTARWVSSACFAATLGVLWAVAGAVAAALTAPLWVLAVAHAPYLDRHPVPVTVDYALGVALAVLGGYAAQTGTVAPVALGVAGAYFAFLAGAKVPVDRLDYAFDRSLPKRTLPVALGPDRARVVGALLLSAAGVTVAVLSLAGVFPPAALAAAPVPVLAASLPFVVAERRAVRLQAHLGYVFGGVLLLALRFDAVSGLLGVAA